MYVKAAAPERDRFFTPQVKAQSETFPRQAAATTPKPFPGSDARTVRNLHQEYQSILQNFQGDLYLVDVLEMLKLVPSEPALLQFLRQSSQNMMVKQEGMPESEDLTKNLFRIFCSIIKVQLNQRDSTFLEERVIQQYLDSINLQRDPDMVYIDELAAIKGLINRSRYALTDRHVKLVHEKFKNLYENRINFINSQPRHQLQANVPPARQAVVHPF